MMTPIQQVHAELERNWACSQADYPSRLTNINAMPYIIPRLAERTLLEFARLFPNATSSILNRNFPEPGSVLLGAGSQHTVLAMDDNIKKINRRSVFMDEEDRRSLAQESITDHTEVRKYLGSLILEQTTEIGPHPLNTSKRAVQHVQEFFHFTALDLFPAYDHRIDPQKLDIAKRLHPGIEDELGNLTAGGLRLHSEKSLVPDVSGLNNMVLVGTPPSVELVCLDSLPVSERTDPGGVKRIVDQLTDLKSQL